MLEKGGKNFRLFPKKKGKGNNNNNNNCNSGSRVMLGTTTKFLEEERKICFFSILPKNLSLEVIKGNITMEVNEKLSKFNEVIFYKLPKELPPVMSISH